MLLYVDLDLGRFVGAPGFGSPARATEHKRGDGGEISIQFCQGTTLVSLPDSSDIIYQGKAAGKYDAAPLIECSTFANAATSGGVHTGALTYDVTALNTALLVDNDDSNDLAFLNAMFEVTWRPPGKGWASTDTLSGKINNDVVRSSQGLLPAIASELPGVLATARATFGGTATINITVGALTVGTWSVNLWDGSTGSAPAVPYLSYGGSGNWSEWVAAFVQLINTGGVTASGIHPGRHQGRFEPGHRGDFLQWVRFVFRLDRDRNRRPGEFYFLPPGGCHKHRRGGHSSGWG
jgi:hypothetical protein